MCGTAAANGYTCGFVERPHARVYFELAGSGPPLVLVHGGAHHAIFHGAMGGLRRTLVFYDQRGYGHTWVDPEHGPAGSLALDVADLDALRAHLGFERIDLLALSNGGPVAIDYALAHPDRTRSLILLDTYADNDDRTVMAWKLVPEALDDPGRIAAVDAIRRDQSLAPLQRKIEEFLILPHPHHHSPLPRSLVEAWHHNGVLAPPPDAEQRAMGSPSARDYGKLAELARITCPALVICGRHDRVTPLAHSDKMARALPRGQLVVLENSGHLGLFEEQERFAEIVETFLRGQQ